MPLYKVTELQEFLQRLHRGAKRTLSQNFLVDGNIVDKIVTYSGAQAGDVVIEIGPGPGVLTEALLAKGCKVIAIELDEEFARALSRFAGQDNLLVLSQDVLDASFPELVSTYASSQRVCRIVSNIPYHITKEIFLKIARTCPHPFEAILMVQEEVAHKLTKEPISSSLFAMQLAVFGSVSWGFRVSRSCFYPQPSVHSAVLTYRSHEPSIADSCKRDQFLSCLAKVYGQRRKTLVSTLCREYGYDRAAVEHWLCQNGLSITSRPDELDLMAWQQLYAQIER